VQTIVIFPYITSSAPNQSCSSNTLYLLPEGTGKNVPVHAMMAYGEVKVHSFLTLTLEEHVVSFMP